jgi:outer membrane protein assembly factor BamB
MNLKTVIFLVLISSSLSLASQGIIEFKSTIKEHIVNNYTGTLLVKTQKRVSAINAKTQQVSWTNVELEKVSFSEYSEIPYTPIILFDQKPLINSKILSSTLNSKGVSRKMLNIITGKVLFDSEKQGFKAVNKTLILPQKKAVLVDGIKNKEFVISLYSYKTGKQIWQTKRLNSKFFKTVKGVLFDNEKILLDAQQNIYWLKNKQLLKIDGETGAILFEKENITSIVLNASKNILFVFSDTISMEKLDEENIINAFDTKTQQSLWKGPLKIWGNISNTSLDKGSMVVITSKGFNIIDIKTGTKKMGTIRSITTN